MFRTPFLSILLLCFCTVAAHSQTDEFHLDETYAIADNGTIELQSDDAEVRIVGSDRTDVHVKVDYRLSVSGIVIGSADKFEMIVEEENGNLKLREKPRDLNGRGMIGSMKEEYTILIEAPRNVNLKTQGDDESYDISGIDGRVEVNADDTEVNMKDCGGTRFAFVMDDGRLYMDRGRGRLEVRMDDGDMEILQGDFSAIDVRADDALLAITSTMADEGDYRFEIDDSDLTFTVTGGGGTFEVRHDNARISATGSFDGVLSEDHLERYRLDGGTGRLFVRTDDGRIRLLVR